jgi:protein-disulfide isomerase
MFPESLFARRRPIEILLLTLRFYNACRFYAGRIAVRFWDEPWQYRNHQVFGSNAAAVLRWVFEIVQLRQLMIKRRQMLIFSTILWVLAASWGSAQAPAIDKARLASYIHYAEGFTDAVVVTLEDPTASNYKDFYRVVAHMRAGATNLGDRTYYVTADGKHVINGTVWDLAQSPFSAILNEMPKGLPSFGPADAPVTIVVFSDFQCPYCRSLAQSMRQNVPKSFPKDVRVEFADFPLESKHPWARAAAEASHCIGDNNNNAFWDFHDWIFEHQGDIDPEGKNLRDKVLEYAKQQNLDAAKLTTCLDGHTTGEEVASNQKKAFLLGVQQTPTFFINGRKVEGAVPWSNVETLIQYEMKRPANVASGAKTGGE